MTVLSSQKMEVQGASWRGPIGILGRRMLGGKVNKGKASLYWLMGLLFSDIPPLYF